MSPKLRCTALPLRWGQATIRNGIRHCGLYELLCTAEKQNSIVWLGEACMYIDRLPTGTTSPFLQAE